MVNNVNVQAQMCIISNKSTKSGHKHTRISIDQLNVDVTGSQGYVGSNTCRLCLRRVNVLSGVEILQFQYLFITLI